MPIAHILAGLPLATTQITPQVPSSPASHFSGEQRLVRDVCRFAALLCKLSTAGPTCSGALTLVELSGGHGAGVLQGVSPTYRHDLESVFYIFLWVCVCRGAERFSRGKASHDRVLTSWYTGDYE